MKLGEQSLLESFLESGLLGERPARRLCLSLPPKQSKAKQSRPVAAAAAAVAGCCCKSEEKGNTGETGWCGTRLLWAAAAAVSRPAADYGSKCALLPALCVLRSSVARQHRAKAVGQDQDSSSCCAYLFYLSR